MNTIQSKSQFKTLIQDEMTRLESMVNQNNLVSTYPVAYSRYTSKGQSSILKRQKSTYHSHFLSIITQLKFMSFFF